MVKQTQTVKVIESSAPVTDSTMTQSVKNTKVSRVKKLKEVPEESVVMPVVTTSTISTPASPVQVQQVEPESVTAPVSELTTPEEETTKPKKNRNYDELFAQIRSDITTAYQALRSATRLVNGLENAHKRAITVNKVRETPKRTPTIMFDEDLVKYFRSKLTSDELVVNRKEGKGKVTVSLSDLSMETKLHRTDVTQLYNAIFKKYNMQSPEDGRVIKADADLIQLLTSGQEKSEKPEMAEDIAAIKAGTFKLTIFNIQRFTNLHLSKFEAPPTPSV